MTDSSAGSFAGSGIRLFIIGQERGLVNFCKIFKAEAIHSREKNNSRKAEDFLIKKGQTI